MRRVIGRPYTVEEAQKIIAVFHACTRAIEAGFDSDEATLIGQIAQVIYADR